MRQFLIGLALMSSCALPLTVVSAAGTGGAPFAYAPAAQSGEQGRDWSSIAKLPDWRGAWGLDRDSFGVNKDTATSSDPKNPHRAPLTPEWEAKRMSNGAMNNGQGPLDTGVLNNSAKCIPNGMPGLMSAPFAFEFVYAPGVVYVIPENNSLRRIFTDGRGHPADVDPSYNGHSIGYWEGSTLVVETTAIMPDSEFFMGLKESGEAKVVERFHRVSPTKFQIDFTVTDPKAMAKPFVYSRTYDAAKQMVEYYCTQNNRDSNGEIDLTPPPE